MPSVEVTARKAQTWVIRAVVAHDADALHRQQHGEGLPDRVVEAGVADLEIDGVGLAQDLELLARHGAGDADGAAGPGNGWRFTIRSGRPSSRPKARTSSL